MAFRPFVLAMLMLGGCIFSPEQRPAMDVGANLAGAHVFRGQVMNDRAVAQGEARVQLPTRDGGAVVLRGWGNLDLREETGRAWFDDGHRGSVTQLDLSAAYARQVGGLDVAVGAVHYVWPFGERFPFRPFDATTEVFAEVAGEVLGARPALSVHHDVDDVGGFYLRARLDGRVALGKDADLELGGWLGWGDDEHNHWLWKTPRAGFTDLAGSAMVAFQLDPITRLRCGVAGSTVLDDDLRRWMRGKIDADNLWWVVGIGWAW